MLVLTTLVTRRARGLLLVLAAVAATLTLGASSALGATQTYIGDQPATPDIVRGGLTFFMPNGQPGPGSLAGTINLALDGVPVVAYCLEATRPLNEASVVATVTPRAAATQDGRAILWILNNQRPTGPPTPEKQQQAAAAQVAIWILRGQVAATNPTNDAALNAAAAALVATARAQSAVPASLTMVGAAGGPGSGTASIAITARPGAVVALTVSSGPGTLSSSTVSVGSDGRGSVTVSNPGPGTTVTGTTAGDGNLLEIDPVDGSQNTVIAGESQLQASVTLSETAVTSASHVQGSLRITKTAPARAHALARVRYKITVRNPTRFSVRNVVLRDRLPSGMSYAGSSRNGDVVNGSVRWSLGTLGPRASRTVTVWLRANALVRGTRTNVATVSATGVRTVQARVSTLFQAVQRQTRPAVAVTG